MRIQTDPRYTGLPPVPVCHPAGRARLRHTFAPVHLPEAGRRHDGNIPKLHKPAGKAHNQTAEVRNATDDVRRKKRGIAL